MSKAIPRFAAGLAVVLALAGAGLGASLVAPETAGAATVFTVNDAADFALSGSVSTCTSTNATCTLRAAIQASTNVDGDTTINLPDPTTLGAHSASAYLLTLGQLDIADLGGTVTIVGAGSDLVTIEAAASSGIAANRVLQVDAGAATNISGVTIANGVSVNANGGGILADGPLTLSNCVVTANEATGGGRGGGIDMGGAGDLTLDSVTVSDNNSAATGGDGGGIELGTDTITPPIDTIVNSTISDNTTAQDGGGIDQSDDSTLGVTNTTINGNTAGSLGGGFYDNNNVDGNPTGTVTFSDDTISNNDATSGGGMFNDHGSNITFTDSTISGNVASNGGGGGFELESNPDTLDITGSTVSGNTATNGTGGGVDNPECDTLHLTNDTLAANTATGGGGGFFGATNGGEGGACAAGQGVNFLFDTVHGNTAGTGGGDVDLQASAAVNLSDSIVAGGNPSCVVGASASLVSGGYNLLGDASCGTPAGGDIVGKDPLLGALANNGGPTLTELPGSTSPAIAAIPAAVCSGTGIGTDQRGNSRGAGINGSCTIGAVEVSNFNPNGYRMVADEGGIFDFGLNFNGSLANNHLNAPIVGIANSPGPNGYLMVGSDGGVFALGGANFYGSLCCNALPSPIAAIAATPSEDGYWLAAQNGKISNFGNTPALPAVQVPAGAHIVGMASTNDGKGLWLTDNLGDVYAVGDALYLGGMGGIHLNAPVVGIAAAASGQGYVLAASDGGTFNFGVGFFGSVPGSLKPGQHLVAPIVGIAVTHSGNGYWMVGADGGLFNYGDAPFLGSIYTAIDGTPLNGPIVGIQHLGAAPPV